MPNECEICGEEIEDGEDYCQFHKDELLAEIEYDRKERDKWQG